MARRMAGLQTGCPYELELIHVQQGEKSDEKQLHESLKKFKTSGEWFMACADTYRKLGIKEDCPTLDPVKVGIVPTQRQYWLSYRFVTHRNANSEMVIPLNEFCLKYSCTEEEVFAIDPKYAEFEIRQLSSRAAKELYGYEYRSPVDDNLEFVLVAKWRIKLREQMKSYVPPDSYGLAPLN